MSRFRNTNRFKVRNKVNTKLNDLLSFMDLGDASFWPRWLWTYFFKTPMNLSKGNILCRNIGPKTLISSHRWTRTCVMMLKKDGGNTNSKLKRHCTKSFSNLGMISGSISFWEIALRNAHSFTMANQTFSGRSPLNATGSSCVIITWQSWDFRFWNFFLWHIYYSLYIQREARRDLHTEQTFKKDFPSLLW